MKHFTDNQLAKYWNTYVVPQYLKIRRIILSGQLDKKGVSPEYNMIILWTVYDNREFDELMSIKLRNEVSKDGNLLELDF